MKHFLEKTRKPLGNKKDIRRGKKFHRLAHPEGKSQINKKPQQHQQQQQQRQQHQHQHQQHQQQQKQHQQKQQQQHDRENMFV